MATKNYTSDNSFTVPPGVTTITVGGKAGGSGGYTTPDGILGGKGGYAGEVGSTTFTVTPGDTVSITVGSGGAAATSGGDTTFTSPGNSYTLQGGGTYTSSPGTSASGPDGGPGASGGGSGGFGAIDGSTNGGNGANGGGGGGGSADGHTPGVGGDGSAFISWTVPTPYVAGLSGGGSTLAGGTSFGVVGANFSPAIVGTNRITVDGIDCTGVTYSSPTSMTATCPAGGSVGVKSVSVINEDNGYGSVSGFTYYDDTPPSSGGAFVIGG